MGKLAGFKYRQIIKKLKKLGMVFDRQAAGSHEIWFNPATDKYTTIPNHPGDMPEGTLRAIIKETGDVIISRKPGSWDDYFKMMETIDVPEDFMAERDNEIQQERDLF